MANVEAILDRPLPHNLDAERRVLGAILNDNKVLDRVLHEGLKPDDCFLAEHRRIFRGMIAMREKQKPTDNRNDAELERCTRLGIP